jgi:hypothetical protein
MSQIDNGNDTIDTGKPEADARHNMLTSAAAIATFVVDSESRLAETAKAWGHSLFVAVKTDGLSLDTMIGESKLAAQWTTLTLTEAGRKAKQRLEVYFSNARLVAEKWDGMTDDERRDILSGLSSIHYKAGLFRKAEADAKKAAKKEAARVAAEKAAAEAKAEADESGEETRQPEATRPTLAEMVDAVLSAYQTASAEEKAEAHEFLEALFDVVNADIAAEAATLAEAEAKELADAFAAEDAEAEAKAA